VALVAAAGLFVVWMLATYLLEGRIRTLLRPDDTAARLLYALVANLAIGIGGAALLMRAAVRRSMRTAADAGLRGDRRTAVSLALGFALGGTLFVVQRPVTLAPAVLLNAFAQVWVVSVAEVLVCWVALGGAIGRLGGGSIGWRLMAWIAAAAAFAVYHFAHSPPFNTPEMVGLLAIVGLGTGGFYFTLREVYGTIVFHNFLALQGVTRALAESGRLEAAASPEVPLLVTALAVTTILILLDRLWIRRPSGSDRGFTSSPGV